MPSNRIALSCIGSVLELSDQMEIKDHQELLDKTSLQSVWTVCQTRLGEDDFILCFRVGHVCVCVCVCVCVG